MKNIIVSLFIIGLGVAKAAPVAMECRGPGFDYAEFGVVPSEGKIAIRLAHFFFDLNTVLHDKGILKEGVGIWQVRAIFDEKNCRVHAADARILLCEAPKGELEVKDRDASEVYRVAVDFLRIGTESRRSADFLTNGFVATLRGNIQGTGVREVATLSHNETAPEPDCVVQK